MEREEKALISGAVSVNRKPHLHGLIGALSGICWFMHSMPECLSNRDSGLGGAGGAHFYTFDEKKRLERERSEEAYILWRLCQAERRQTAKWRFYCHLGLCWLAQCAGETLWRNKAETARAVFFTDSRKYLHTVYSESSLRSWLI